MDGARFFLSCAPRRIELIRSSQPRVSKKQAGESSITAAHSKESCHDRQLGARSADASASGSTGAERARHSDDGGQRGLRWEDLNDPASPVVVQIVLAPGTILLNDLVELSWQGEPAGSVNVNADHLSAGVITMPVDVADILEHPDGEHGGGYTVTPAFGGNLEPSPPRTVRVKRRVPGGNDSDAGNRVEVSMLALRDIAEFGQFVQDNAVKEYKPTLANDYTYHDNKRIPNGLRNEWSNREAGDIQNN